MRFAIAWILSLSLAATAAAQPRRAEGVAALRLAASSLQRCPRLEVPLPEEEELEWGRALEVELDGNELLWRDFDGGQGVDAEHGVRTTLVRLDRCSMVTSDSVWWDGARVAPMVITRSRTGGRGAPSVADVARVAGATADPARAESAAGRLLVTTTCQVAPVEVTGGGALAVTRALAPAQPWIAGPPRGAPALYWPRALLRQIGAPVESGVLEGGAATPDGVVSFAVAAPTHVRTVGALQIWESTLGGRNGGVAIALYDRAQDRHRWVIASAHCHPDMEGAFLLATSIRWEASGADVLVGRATSRHGVYAARDGIVAIDLRSGAAHLVEVARGRRSIRPEDVRTAIDALRP
jgi:hypothetical protein